MSVHWSPDVQQRRVFWEDVFQGQVAESVFAGKLQEGQRLLAIAEVV